MKVSSRNEGKQADVEQNLERIKILGYEVIGRKKKLKGNKFLGNSGLTEDRRVTDDNDDDEDEKCK